MSGIVSMVAKSQQKNEHNGKMPEKTLVRLVIIAQHTRLAFISCSVTPSCSRLMLAVVNYDQKANPKGAGKQGDTPAVFVGNMHGTDC